ncbi:MAG: XdhC family protein [Gammaproteobacteria bacterium]
MQLGLNALYAFLDACTTECLVLATVTRTEGASYRKAGAMMLIDEHFNASGLVSGGCLEDDLKAHAEGVFNAGESKTVLYDLSQEEAASMWGLGLGCGGQIEVLLERIGSDNGYGGLEPIREFYYSGHACTLHKTIASDRSERIGTYELTQELAADLAGLNRHAAEAVTRDQTTTLSIPISPVRRLLVCGAGPDAIPLVALAGNLSWQVIVADPRPAYLRKEHFPTAWQLLECSPSELGNKLQSVQAAVIMTHNVERDCDWLVALHERAIQYIGLLGPTARRDLLLERSGLKLESRLHGPAGLNIGAVLPEEIALSILAEIHAVLGLRSGLPLSAL